MESIKKNNKKYMGFAHKNIKELLKHDFVSFDQGIEVARVQIHHGF